MFLSATKTGLSLTNNQKYFIMVKAVNGAGLVSDSIVSDGVIYLMPTGINSLNNLSSLTIYPNPTSDKATISLISDKAESLDYNLYDAVGKLIEHKKLEIISGINTLEININQLQLSKGVYLIKLLNSDKEMIKKYQGYPVFYTYKASESKHIETFESFSQSSSPSLTPELTEWWNTHKKDGPLFENYYLKTMTTWLCREIPNKAANGLHWEDVELPSWAANELSNKKVELVFPYFDGVDRMGFALVLFPNGIDAKKEKDIEITFTFREMPERPINKQGKKVT